MALTAAQKADRLALIKDIAERKGMNKPSFKMRARKSTSKASKVVRDYTKNAADRFDKEIAKLDENYNQWTDASAYAKEYYGGVAYETTRFDNDWN